MEKLYNLKIGLVLAGGGGKGAYQAGVMKALWELDLIHHVKVVSGVSVGTLNALMMCMMDRELIDKSWSSLSYSKIMTRGDGLKVKDIRDLVMKIAFNKEVNSSEELDLGALGLISQKGIREYIEEFVDVKVLHETDTDVYSCAYNINDGKPEYFKLNDYNEEEIIDITIGSCAVPFVFTPVSFKGKQYADGGINNPLYAEMNADNIPINPLIDYDCDLIIVMHLSQSESVDRDKYPQENILEIYPSEMLEVLNGTGTFNFNQNSIHQRMELGYRDGLAALVPLAIAHLKGEPLDSLIKHHNEQNESLIRKRKLFD